MSQEHFILEDCECDGNNLSDEIAPISPLGNARRRHFRQFCHCNCSCIHKCHHEHEHCDEESLRPWSPRISENLNDTTLGMSSLFLSNNKVTHTESIAEVLEEMETGKLSLSYGSITPPRRKRQLSDFAMERDLGEGAYAFVKQARYRNSSLESPPVAVKMLIKSKILSECILHDFDTGLSLPVELYALRHLRDHPHSNIVSMIDAFEDSMYSYILMPMHGKGEDLFEAIEKSIDFIPPDRVAMIFSQIVMAIAHLHNVLGIAHRDIKDENIIIDEKDRIQLIDFGSCAYYRRGGPCVQENVPLTEADVRVGKRMMQFQTFHGTADYAPPEVIRDEPYDGPQQDIWALGVLLYTIAFKEAPFRSSNDILEHRLLLPFSPSPQISDMIKRLLNPDIDARPTAAELASDPWILESYRQAMDKTTDS